MLEEIGVRRRRGLQRIRWLDGITNSVDMSLCKTPWISDGQGGLACCDSWVAKSDTTKGLNWTEPIWRSFRSLFHWMSFIPYYLFLLLWDLMMQVWDLAYCLISPSGSVHIFSVHFFFFPENCIDLSPHFLILFSVIFSVLLSPFSVLFVVLCFLVL